MPQSHLIALVLMLGTPLVCMSATHHGFINRYGGGHVTENPEAKAALS